MGVGGGGPGPCSKPAPCAAVMSEAGSDTLDDEWQSITEIASTCNTILESLSREGEVAQGVGEGPGRSACFAAFQTHTVPLSPRTAHPREWRP